MIDFGAAPEQCRFYIRRRDNKSLPCSGRRSAAREPRGEDLARVRPLSADANPELAETLQTYQGLLGYVPNSVLIMQSGMTGTSAKHRGSACP